jgi:mono/diheme cytochrome c family protein
VISPDALQARAGISMRVSTCALCVLLVFAGCRKEDMAEQPRYNPMDASRFYPDGRSARPLVQGTVPRGGRPVSDSIFAVTAATAPEATSFPFQLSLEDLETGHRQFDIFCAPCHGRLGDGNGVIVQRGFPRPPSYYLDRLRSAPPGHFYNVITHGFGAMYSYNERISEQDRWRIVGYIRALQLSDPENRGLPDPRATKQ